ncbi:alpha/beta hydrolase [Rhodococcus sp. IEGM 1408]|uniref:alpha/beta fold hydrolase n=1 Tax=Rhodococcus sp. IEGM 1408 TaxID=3082220 RepID=UPI002954FB7E|nr:alpha/beta hydrolase [Rhodococcus sp. IEGM 1408]MDV8001561.1 alpha/beta hydrolase [Rhodococcus sp. IEGM 1408]
MTSATSNSLASAVSTDGTVIAYRALGDPAARPLVLIHGWAQSSSSWGSEVLSDLAQRFRVVAIDLRGHGHSDVPEGGYDSSQQWADDIEAVLDAAGVGEAGVGGNAGAILLGWSYGGVVVSDYLAARGEGRIAGIVLCGAVTSLSRSAGGAIGPAMKEVTSGGAFDEKPAVALAAFTSFGRAMMRSGAGADGQRILGLSLATPPAVRQKLLTRRVDNDDALRALTIPALVIHGAHDGVVLPSAGQANAEMIPGGRYVEFAGSAHAPFLEETPRFLSELDAFAAEL